MKNFEKKGKEDESRFHSEKFKFARRKSDAYAMRNTILQGENTESLVKREKKTFSLFSNQEEYVDYHRVKVLDAFMDAHKHFSLAFDVLASHLKGHKIMYSEAESYSQYQLSFLMYPCIFCQAWRLYFLYWFFR